MPVCVRLKLKVTIKKYAKTQHNTEQLGVVHIIYFRAKTKASNKPRLTLTFGQVLSIQSISVVLETCGQDCLLSLDCTYIITNI